MTTWIVGRGIVGRRLERLLDVAHSGRHDTRFYDTRYDLPDRVGERDLALLCHRGQHAPVAAALAERGASVVTVGDGTPSSSPLRVAGARTEADPVGPADHKEEKPAEPARDTTRRRA